MSSFVLPQKFGGNFGESMSQMILHIESRRLSVAISWVVCWVGT